MRRFTLGQRVLVRATFGPHVFEERPIGRLVLGTVVRLLRRDDGAWVELDERVDDSHHPFPHDDDGDRARYVLTYPDLCGSAATGARA